MITNIDLFMCKKIAFLFGVSRRIEDKFFIKTKVVLEALREEQISNEIAAKL